ncbi:hypothetical protein TNCV_4961281 [Trichonephila clavipes]|uniref:Uncharacterized protein n=1 Tax=Trichonephila clavipes TaxID=2585209 RepID=A0A8X6SVM6_TRICX|nr:hypothetical protein TNCV_4961281 [Trichonephila clavipes]
MFQGSRDASKCLLWYLCGNSSLDLQNEGYDLLSNDQNLLAFHLSEKIVPGSIHSFIVLTSVSRDQLCTATKNSLLDLSLILHLQTPTAPPLHVLYYSAETLIRRLPLPYFTADKVTISHLNNVYLTVAMV